MISFSLWTEVTISGFFYLVGVFFIILNLAGVKDFAFLSGLKDYVTLLAVFTLFISYLFGVLTLRMLQILLSPISQSLAKLLKNKDLAVIDRDVAAEHNVIIFQYGSERLQREVDLQFSLYVMFSSLIFSIPFVGLTSYLWLAKIHLTLLGQAVLITSFAFGIVFLIIGYRQRKNHNRLKDKAVKHLQDTIKKQMAKR